jgi:hypothetical protein
MELESGMTVTYGNSKLEWKVDNAYHFCVYLSRQHMKPNARHHLSFKRVEAKDFDKLHVVEIPDEPLTPEQDAAWRKSQGYSA